MSEKCLLCENDRWHLKGLLEFVKGKDLLCGPCRRSFTHLDQTVKWEGVRLHIGYVYNESMESSLFQFKNGDSKLAPIFFYNQKSKIKKISKRKFCVIPPSSREKTEYRGFIPLELCLEEIKLKVEQPFVKSDGYEQKMSKERGEVANHILLKHNIQHSSHCLLIDDVATSGTTLKTCINLLRNHGVLDIEVYVLSATESFIKSVGINLHKEKKSWVDKLMENLVKKVKLNILKR